VARLGRGERRRVHRLASVLLVEQCPLPSARPPPLQAGQVPSAESGSDGSLIKPMAPENLLALQRPRDRCVQVYRSRIGHGSENMHKKKR